MDAFYRRVRRRTGLLMDENGGPVGGKLSFDADNRKPWPGDPPAPAPPRFQADAITREVADLVRGSFGHHPGSVCLDTLPATREDAETLWAWALAACLPLFGPYEDAMSRHSSGLFHTRISPLLNLHRLLPSRVVDDVVNGELPLASCEGFVRQVIGWRELVRHVHRATDGFRELPAGRAPVAETPSDAGWSRWSGSEWPRTSASSTEPDGGACPSELGADNPLPPAFWGQPSGLACLDHVVADVWREGWSHHITRLMVLCNLATLLDIDPRELTDWFWVAYTDAYDWVVEPNVLAMGTFAVGDLMTTKPYVSGAAYIDRMSDYCGACRFDPKRTCPITRLYWAFLDRHHDTLRTNPRLRVILASLTRRSEEKRLEDNETFTRVSTALANGQEVVEPP
jgi:deoxyribodipyrimidine photolyase-related protein